MLTDPVEIEIISAARQANVRNPKRSRKHFERIFQDFLGNVRFENTAVLDLGPGQWDFGVLAQERGATAWGVDNDPAVLKLGMHKGFHAVEGNLSRPATFGQIGPFDGLFCKFSINAFWSGETLDAQRKFAKELFSFGAPGAWVWIAPWNGVPKNFTSNPSEVLDLQKVAFEELGCASRMLTDEETSVYGVHGGTANSIVFTRNL